MDIPNMGNGICPSPKQRMAQTIKWHKNERKEWLSKERKEANRPRKPPKTLYSQLFQNSRNEPEACNVSGSIFGEKE